MDEHAEGILPQAFSIMRGIEGDRQEPGIADWNA
jgi:hypothetical protein